MIQDISLPVQIFIFFIDPYGYKEIDPDDLERIMGVGNTEILIFFPATFMYRFAAAVTKTARILCPILLMLLWLCIILRMKTIPTQKP